VATSCDPADINYNLCLAITDRMADDSHRLDLAWWGVWGVVGLLLVLIIVPMWLSAWGFERKVAGHG